MGLTVGLTELFASCQFVPSAQRIGPPTGPSHLEMTPSSTSSSEAATSRTWLCVNRPNQHALFLRTPPLSRYTVTHTAGGWGVFRERSGWNSNRLCCPRQSSMSSSSSSSAAAAPTPFQSAGSYGLFNRAPVPAYNQFSASPLVSPQFGPVGVGKHNTLAHLHFGAWYPRVQGLSVALAPRTSCYRNWGATDSWRRCDFKQSRPSLSSPHVESEAEFWAQLWSWI